MAPVQYSAWLARSFEHSPPRPADRVRQRRALRRAYANETLPSAPRVCAACRREHGRPVGLVRRRMAWLLSRWDKNARRFYYLCAFISSGHELLWNTYPRVVRRSLFLPMYLPIRAGSRALSRARGREFVTSRAVNRSATALYWVAYTRAGLTPDARLARDWKMARS